MNDSFLSEIATQWAVILTFTRALANQPGIDRQQLTNDIAEHATWAATSFPGDISAEPMTAYAERIGQLLRSLAPPQAGDEPPPQDDRL